MKNLDAGLAGSTISYNALPRTGTYVGDATANKAIAHGLGRIPHLVVIRAVGTTQGYGLEIGACDNITQFNTGANAQAVTASDAVNFYVGNAASYANSSNTNLQNYEWVAI